MHQHPRPAPRMASPASSPMTNPHRTNNSREESPGTHSRLNSEAPAYSEAEQEMGSGGDVAVSGPSREAIKKLDQIIQNFHTKAAIVILQSRMSLPIIMTKDQNRKVNKWFQLETDDTEAFRDDLRLWKTCGGFDQRPPPLILETYLDTSELTSSQSLVIVDDQGKLWDVAEALAGSSGAHDSSIRHQKPGTEVILERWKIQLKDGVVENPYDFGAILPTIYKKCIVFFRSLYATSKFVPTWRFVRALAKAGASSNPLRVNCRIINGNDFEINSRDGLTHPLYSSNSPVTSTFSLGDTDSPAGRFSAEICYRNDCNFRVDDSESLLSSRFMGVDEQYFQPSLSGRDDDRRRKARTVEVGSLPVRAPAGSFGQTSRFGHAVLDEQDPIQAYGSLSTFHGNAHPLGSSPISALRAARTMGSEGNPSPVSSFPRTHSIQTGTSSPRPLEGITVVRRPSTSFNPFKAGSLSASPIPGSSLMQTGEIHSPQSPHSLPRGSGISALTQARNRSSLTAGMPASLRGVPIAHDNVVPSSASSSPRPVSLTGRYSSSFGHRRGKHSFGMASKIDDDQGSSGKQSLSSSSAQPGSGILAEGPGGSSGSLQTDGDDIGDFLKMLDSKKTLQSFEKPRASEESAKRTNAQLSRFQSMRESNNALTESMSSSMLLHRSSSSSSRQLSSVPPMIAATSMSTSSSPGKPVSPHTPHTPAIPSRLSANSIVEYSQPRIRHGTRTTPESRIEDVSGDESSGLGTNANAIDIPTSPRPYYPHNRRSSSVAQQQRHVAVDEDIGDLPFGAHRSISLGADDREPPSLSDLLGLGQASDAAVGGDSRDRILQPAAQIDESTTALARHASHSLDTEGPQQSQGMVSGSSTVPYRPRIGRGTGRGLTPPTGSDASLGTDRGSASGMSDRPRFAFSRPTGPYEVDDEPLLFDMSEIGRDQGRRSLEETRGGGSIGGNACDRGGFDTSRGGSDRGGFDGSRGGDSGSSSRRGSRRGW